MNALRNSRFPLFIKVNQLANGIDQSALFSPRRALCARISRHLLLCKLALSPGRHGVLSNRHTAEEVDASGEEERVYVDLESISQVFPASPANEPDSWDIAFQRSDIKINSGASGAGAVGIHDIFEGDWEAITAVPADVDYHRDDVDALAFVTYPEGGGSCSGVDTDYGWYHYSYFCNEGDGIHHISPRDVVYIVKDGDQFWKLRMLGYYSDNGDSGHLSAECSPIAAN